MNTCSYLFLVASIEVAEKEPSNDLSSQQYQ